VSNIVRFGIFELDLSRNELRRKGVRIKVHQQPFEILRLLVEHRGEMVSRQLIQKTLWPEDHFVDFERSINTAIMRLRHALRESAKSPAYIETVARTGYRLLVPVVEEGEGRRIRAIAILPLQDLSGLPDTQYFVDGLTDSLVTAMAVASDLRVVSRPSMQIYKDSRLSSREIAKELNVQALVEGSILRAGDRIRISARLLDASEDRHLWAQTYDRELKNILLLQQEIVSAIVGSTTTALKQGAKPTATRQINPRAYESFLRGNFLMSMRVPDQMSKAAECYEHAIFLEPEWASPYAMLADCCRMQDFHNYSTSKQLLARASTLTEKALRLEPNNARANAAIGAMLAIHEWKWKAGEERLHAALRADPRCSQIEHIYSQVLLNMGRYDEALRHADLSLSIDPSSLFLWSYRAQILLFARRYDESLRESERVLEQHPTFAMGLLNYAGALAHLGRLPEALSAFERAFAGTGLAVALVGVMYIHLKLKRSEEANADMERLKQMHREGNCSPAVLGWGHLAVGDIEGAFPLLEAAIAEHDTRLSLFIHMPHFDIIRDDERFVGMLRQMGLK
jgi:TolB-like protein/tetratricopeptide (TPR) repeat protein